MHKQAKEYTEVIIVAPGQLEEVLGGAEAALRQAAIVEAAAGILVTRHDYCRYTLALDEAVPFGETLEQSLF